jgi:hypothetical protein
MSIEQVQEYLGFGRSARQAKVFERKLRPEVECVKKYDGDVIITQWRTSVGTLRMVQRLSKADQDAHLKPVIIEYPIKSRQDYKVYEEIMRNTEFVATYDSYLEYDRIIGNAGMPVCIVGPIPIHDILINWTGYQQGFMDIFDCPEVVAQALEAGNAAYRQMWKIVAQSPAVMVMHGVNFDTATTSPPIFRKYFLPYLKSFNHQMHLAGKKVAFHADGDMSGLLELVTEADYDVADCFACYPLVKCTIAKARALWQNRITIWGGIPSNMLDSNTSLEQLENHLGDIYRAVAPGNNFILGISDQAMPAARWENIKLISRWVADQKTV